MTRKKRARQEPDGGDGGGGGGVVQPSPSPSPMPPQPPPAKRALRVRASVEERQRRLHQLQPQQQQLGWDVEMGVGESVDVDEDQDQDEEDGAPRNGRGRRRRRYWLMKAEPESRIVKGVDVKFSIDDLMECLEPAAWDGVRNYGARNNLRAMHKGDLAFFYHSNCKNPGIVGVMEVVREASVDETAFDKAHPYYDPASKPEAPRWFAVHVEFRRKFARALGLAELKGYAGAQLKELPLLKAARLSVSEVPEECWGFILGLESAGGGEDK